MKELSSKAQHLLQRARDAGTPDAAARQRVELALLERIASPTATSAALGKSASATASAVKGALLVGLSGAAILVGLEFATPADPRSVAVSPQQALTHAEGPPETAAVNEVARSQATPAVPQDAPPAPRAASEKKRPASQEQRPALSTHPAVPLGEPESNEPPSASRAHEPAAQPATSDRLAQETQGLRAIQRALRSGQGSLALELVASHSALYADGVLHQERAAARIQALCLVGRGRDARAEAKYFERRWTRSPLLARVRSSCR